MKEVIIETIHVDLTIKADGAVRKGLYEAKDEMRNFIVMGLNGLLETARGMNKEICVGEVYFVEEFDVEEEEVKGE